MQKTKLDFSELHQYLNDFSSSIREAGDKTSNSLLEIKGEIATLSAHLTIMNYLLIGLIILNSALFIFVLYKNSRK
ncbi:MAG: hypothetical protein ACM32O_12110 [Clostridia bacterium]